MLRVSNGCLLELAEFLVFRAVCHHSGGLRVVLGSANGFGVCKQRGQPSSPPGQPVPLLQHVSLPLLCETCSSSDGAVT